MNARGVLAFMACIVLIGGVAQAAPYGGVYYEDNFNYETQEEFDAAWPMLFTSSTSVVAQTMTLRLGDGGPADPMEAINPEWNNSIGGTGPSNYNKRNYDILGDSFGDTKMKATVGNDMVIDFWYYDTHSTGYGRQFIELRDYNATAQSLFPITITSGVSAPGGWNYILAFGPYTTTTVGQTNYWWRNVGYGVSAWKNSGLVRSVGWHHFKIVLSTSDGVAGRVDFWDITNEAAPVHATENAVLTSIGTRGLALNTVMYGGGTLTANTPVGFDGWLDNLRITPEPVSLALLGLGSLLLRRRRA